jgi:hypothetical protein
VSDGVPDPLPVGRRLRARYAFAGAGEELARTVPVEDGEPVLLQGGLRLRALGLRRPAVLRLTPRRLSVLLHFALQPDRVVELPRAAVTGADLDRGAVRIAWRGEDGEHVLRLTSGGGRGAPARVLDAGAVADVLARWLASPDGDLPIREQPGGRHRHAT